MNKHLEDLMYQAGLTAQGSWDSMDPYDQQAIERFAELIVRECAKQCLSDDSMRILNHMGVKGEES